MDDNESSIIHVVFTAEKLKQLEAGYHKAREGRIEQFEFDGHLILTSYAHFLIQYLRQRLEVDD